MNMWLIYEMNLTRKLELKLYVSLVMPAFCIPSPLEVDFMQLQYPC